MERRGKLSFAKSVSNPRQAKQNLLDRDMLLSKHIEAQARQLNFTVLGVDGSQSPDELADLIEQHFELTM